MATTRIKDLTNTATTVASDEYLAVDGTTNGTSKITRDNFRTDTAAAFVAAPGTYNLAPLSGGAVPIDKGGTAATTAAGARTSLDVPSNSEAVLVANNLSDVTAATARTNLSVNSVDEVAEATGTKLVGPALYFDGSNDYVEVADDAKLSFTDGTDDLPFSVSAWVKMDDATNFTIASKFYTATGREWIFRFYDTDKLALLLYTDATNAWEFVADVASTAYEGQWIHAAVCFGGAGPNSSNAFSAATASLYINGQLVASTDTQSGTYAGMSDTAQPLWIGRYENTYTKGHIKDVKIFNRELTASEVAELAKGNELGFADEWGGALGGVYTSDFSAGADGWAGVDVTVAGNIDSVGPGGDLRDDTLRSTISATAATHRSRLVNQTTSGKRYRVEFDYYIPSSNTVTDGFGFHDGNVFTDSAQTRTLDAWTRFTDEFVADGDDISLYWSDSTNTNYTGSGSDVGYIRNVTVTEIGTLADFRSERFDSSTGKWYDLSDNAFVGTNSGATLVGREVPVYETGTWSGVYAPTTGSFATMTMDTDLVYTRIGNLVSISGSIQTDNVDATGASGALKITGLPFAAAKVSTCQVGFAWNWGVNFPISGAVSASTIYLYKRTSSTARTDDIDVTDLSTGALANRNTLYISATYKIQ